MNITDRPGRFFALLIFAPFLLFCGYKIKRDYLLYGIILIIFGFGLFFYELYWISFKNFETKII